MATRPENKWRGYFPALVTPFKEDGSIDESAFRQNIQMLIRDGVHGVIATGTTGEYWSLTDEERKRLYQITAEETKGIVIAIGGATSVSTRKVIDFAEHAKKVGLDGIMVAPVPGVLPKRRDLFAHYKAVSDAVDIGILLYNFAERYGVDMPPAFVGELADLEHVVAIKESCKDFRQQTATVRVAGDRIAILAGWPALRALPSIVMGVDGLVGSIEPQVMGRLARELWDCATGGGIERAREIQMMFIALQEGVAEAVGTWPAQLKTAMNLLHRPGGYPRKPVLPLTPDETAIVESALRKLKLL